MSLELFLKQNNLNLTEQQKKAVEAVDGPTLLLAVPGSGKTTTLVARLGYMIYEKNIEPENILVLTYTVAATKDMSERFVKVFGNDFEERLEFRTINGVCAKIILYYSRMIRKNAFQLEADEKDKARRISRLYQELFNEFPTESEIRDVSTAFTFIKNMMMTDAEIIKMSSSYNFDLERIYKAYNQSLVADGKMDYDDQMRYAYNILKSSPETLSYFQNIYKYVCVDEAQDTSKIQHCIIALLAGKYDNLFMVGDEDQSIYYFRAAYSQALLEFEQVHKNAKVLVMEENFRSNSNIVECADRFIQKNYYRHKKTMYAHRPAGEEIKLKTLPSRSAQYDYLVKKLEKTKNQTAVLYRNNDSVLPLVDRMDRMGIPFYIKNAELMFFTHRIVTDIIDIISFALEPTPELFMKLYYKLNTYLTKAEAVNLCKASISKNMDLIRYAGVVRMENVYKTTALKDFAADMERLATLKKPFSMINYVVNISGYKEYLKRNKINDNKSYIMREIAKPCDSFREFTDRLEYLKNLLMNETFGAKSDIIFSTIHSSKGLEYDVVYMLDVIDGILPETVPDGSMGKEERMNYEEERRMYYVGITRAKEKLILLDTGEKSSFINETVRSFKPATSKGISFNKHKQPLPGSGYRDFSSRLVKGAMIVHKKFGSGTVVKTDGTTVFVEFIDKVRCLDIKKLYEEKIIEFA